MRGRRSGTMGWREKGRTVPLAVALVLPLCGLLACHPLGASTATMQALTGTNLVSIVTTQKTLLDHGMGIITGQDCSLVRVQDGYKWCRDIYRNRPVAPTLYCYRTIADVVCYDQPSPYPSDRLVGIRPGGVLPTY